MFRNHYKKANSIITPRQDLITDTKAKMMEEVSDLEFNISKSIVKKPSGKELRFLSKLAIPHSEEYRKKLIFACSVTGCAILVTAITLITSTFINQTKKTASSNAIIVANKTPEATNEIDSSLWYGHFSGNGDSSLLTISQNDDHSFKFSLSVTEGEKTEQINGNASITSHTSAQFKDSNGFPLYFTLSNGIVSISKDPYVHDTHAVSFAGDYVNMDGYVDCHATSYFHKMRSLGSDLTYQLDLNSDGVPDNISYKSGILTINKQSHNFTDESANLDISTFHIVDINERDDFINLLIMDDGPSCDPVTTVITYTTDGKITCSPLGCNVEQLSFDNLGTISGFFRFDLLQTWYGACKWNYQYNKVDFIEQEYYIPADLDSSDEQTISSNQSILLYKKPSLKSREVTLKPQPVKFVKTDNVHWVEVIGLKDHTNGWLYLTDFNEVPDESKSAEDLFDNLILAD